MNIRTSIAIFIIFLGVATVIYGIVSSYQIFTGVASAPELFDVPEERAQQGSGDVIQDAIQQALQEQVGNVIPPENITKLLNLISWSIFAGLAFFGGAQLAGIGVKLLNRKEE